jgi:hypothetical protein
MSAALANVDPGSTVIGSRRAEMVSADCSQRNDLTSNEALPGAYGTTPPAPTIVQLLAGRTITTESRHV